MAARPRAFVTRRLPGRALERLAETAEVSVWPGPGGPPPRALAEGAAAADGLLCLLTDRVDEALLRAAPRLRVISSCSAGLDHVDLAAATARGIPVGFTPGVLTETTADLAFALLLAAARRLGEAERWLRAGGWTHERRWEPDLFLGRDLHGAVLGIVGLGAIGLAVARRARGFGMRLLGSSRRPVAEAAALGVEQAPLERLLAESDFVTLHIPLTRETHHLLDARALARMKRTAVLVNTSRGEVVDEAALAEVLREGRIAAAGLDVFEREPLAPESPLLALENAVLTPHIGSASVATRERMAELAVENLSAGLAGRPLPRCANPEVHVASPRQGANGPLPRMMGGHVGWPGGGTAMGLFNEIVKGRLGGQAPAAETQSQSLVQGLLDLLDDDQEGIDGLARRFQGAGLGDAVSSWIGSGQNQDVSADDVLRVLGGGRVNDLSQRAGLSSSQGASVLAALLPALIDKLTPDGSVPSRTDLMSRGRMLMSSPGGAGGGRPGGGGAPTGGGAGGGGPRKPAPDFSDVKAGSSSTAPRPAVSAPPARTYTVAKGDSLSKIAKRFYGDANQWRRIFEANRDQIKNPDLIHPGQELRIPEA